MGRLSDCMKYLCAYRNSIIISFDEKNRSKFKITDISKTSVYGCLALKQNIQFCLNFLVRSRFSNFSHLENHENHQVCNVCTISMKINKKLVHQRCCQITDRLLFSPFLCNDSAQLYCKTLHVPKRACFLSVRLIKERKEQLYRE